MTLQDVCILVTCKSYKYCSLEMCAPSPRRESLREWTAPSILSDADHIITLCVSITMSLLRIITIIITYLRQGNLQMFALGQHTGSPYLRGTRCGTQNCAAELRNVSRAHLVTGQAQAVPIHRPGTQGRSIMGDDVIIGLLLHILTC